MLQMNLTPGISGIHLTSPPPLRNHGEGAQIIARPTTRAKPCIVFWRSAL